MNLRPPGYEPDELPTALLRDMVPETGIEPARDRSHGILSPGRLPIPPLRRRVAPVSPLECLTRLSQNRPAVKQKISTGFSAPSVYKKIHISAGVAHILICQSKSNAHLEE